MNLREETLHWAQGQLGVHEIGGENRGPAVEMYQKAAGLEAGNPWCGAFVNWCAFQAAKNQLVISPLESIQYQGYVQSYYEWAKLNNYIIVLKDVLPGDIFLVWHNQEARYAHMGFVNEKISNFTFRTVEGNSNDNHSREGIKVCSNTRDIRSERIVFVRWTKFVKSLSSIMPVHRKEV